ncbi:MAG: hypothetical protein IJ124_11110 [Clostridia bacterium]|nr:hypothetical protein [Clostridia bacterium]
MERIENMSCSHSVQRVISARVRIIQAMLYVAVAVFTFIGTFGGLYWGIMAVGTLVFTWYFMGIARTGFIYNLSGTQLRVQRVSGFASRPKTEEFARFDLTALRIMAEEGSPLLDGEEAATRAAQPRRVVYDLTSHDRHRDVYVMFLKGAGADEGRQVKAYVEPSAELLACIRRAAPGRVKGFDR